MRLAEWLPMYCLHSNKKAQAVSFDLLIAVSLFLVMLATIVAVWQNQNLESANQLFLQDMQTSGNRTMDFLVSSPGETIDVPPLTNWEEGTLGNAKFIGLAKMPNVIEPSKLKKFIEYAGGYTPSAETNYGIAKAKMLLPYDYFFRVYYMGSDGDDVTIQDPAGTEMAAGFIPDTEKKYAIIILKRSVNYAGTSTSNCPQNRGAVLEGCVAIAELKIFREK